MGRRIDHLVIWVEDPLRSVEFFEKVAGFNGLRVDEFRSGKTMFPSVRISEDSILDLMPRAVAPKLNAKMASMAKSLDASAGHPVHHICISMSKDEFDGLIERLEKNGTPAISFMENFFGARGFAPRAFYFYDLDGNVFEARYYAD
jgi:glyoxylase I family protein